MGFYIPMFMWMYLLIDAIISMLDKMRGARGGGGGGGGGDKSV